MILNCPSCSAKYQIADGAIPAHGRNVRCAACGHFWFQKPESALESVEAEAVAANDSSVKATSKGFSLPFFGEAKSPRAPYQNVRKKARDKIILSQAIGIAVGWGLAFGIIGVGLLMAVNNRNDIVQKWPKSASAFAFFGVPANLYGLEIKSIMVRAGSDAVGPRIIVSGVVQSVSSIGKPVPYLRVTLVDANGNKKDSWMVDPQTIFLEPKAYQAFASLRRNPPSGNLRAIVAFAEPPPKSGTFSANAKHTIPSSNGASSSALAGGAVSHAPLPSASHDIGHEVSVPSAHAAPTETSHSDGHAPTTALGR